MLDVLQIVLHHVALFLFILYEVGHFQHSPVRSPDVVDAGVIVLMIQRAYHFHNLGCLLIFAQSCGSPLVDAGNVDDGLLPRIQYLTDMVQIRTMIEVVAQHQILQIPVAVQLLVVVIGNGEEPRFILSPQHRDAVASEVRARHRHDMACRVVHYPAHHIAQVRVGIGTGVMEFVDS